ASPATIMVRSTTPRSLASWRSSTVAPPIFNAALFRPPSRRDRPPARIAPVHVTTSQAEGYQKNEPRGSRAAVDRESPSGHFRSDPDTARVLRKLAAPPRDWRREDRARAPGGGAEFSAPGRGVL